jgi:hypothetical protein
MVFFVNSEGMWFDEADFSLIGGLENAAVFYRFTNERIVHSRLPREWAFEIASNAPVSASGAASLRSQLCNAAAGANRLHRRFIPNAETSCFVAAQPAKASTAIADVRGTSIRTSPSGLFLRQARLLLQKR